MTTEDSILAQQNLLGRENIGRPPILSLSLFVGVFLHKFGRFIACQPKAPQPRAGWTGPKGFAYPK